LYIKNDCYFGQGRINSCGALGCVVCRNIRNTASNIDILFSKNKEIGNHRFRKYKTCFSRLSVLKKIKTIMYNTREIYPPRPKQAPHFCEEENVGRIQLCISTGKSTPLDQSKPRIFVKRGEGRQDRILPFPALFYSGSI